MTFTWPLKARHRRARVASSAAIEQLTGALLIAGGAAAIGPVMVSTFRVHSRRVLTIAAHCGSRGHALPRHPAVRRRPGT